MSNTSYICISLALIILMAQPLFDFGVSDMWLEYDIYTKVRMSQGTY